MNIYTEEQHGYFTLDMGYYEGGGFEGAQLKGIRFALVLLQAENGQIVWNDEKISFDGHLLICMNEKETIFVPKEIQVTAVCFHPSVLNVMFDFFNIRSEKEQFDITQMQDHYYILSFINHKESQKGILRPTMNSYERIYSLMKCIQDQITKQDTNYWACRSRSYLIEILSICSTLMEEQVMILQNKEDAVEKEMQEIIAYLKSNLYKRITIADLTKEFQINRTDLSKRFTEYTGETIMEYLNRIRIDFAATMLRDTKMPFVDIMERVGFRDYSYFSHTFKKKKGLSPQAYRRKYCWL